ncbi:MAG: mechanosensitive ion channel [Planctomycetes bacterium]|nr:mechanosensitive ion channel [Planctomycetota bacterium]
MESIVNQPFGNRSMGRWGSCFRSSGLAMAVLVTLSVMLAAPGLVATVMAQDTSAATDTSVTSAPAAKPTPAEGVVPLDLNRAFADSMQFLQDYLPRLLLSIAILVVGTVIAWLIAALVRWLLGKTTLDNRLVRYVKGGEAEGGVGSERVIAWIVFWILELFVLVLFFHFLQMAAISESLSRVVQQILDYLPRLLAAGLLLLVGWIIASVLKFLITRGLVAAKVDERFAGKPPPEAGATAKPPLSKSLGNVIFWVILLLFVPGVLSVLAIEGLSVPMQRMVEKVVTFLPNVGLAVIILLLGWLFAGLVRRIVESLMQALGTDRLGERVGLGRVLKRFNLSALVGLVVYILILVPVIIAALNALQVEGITKPASDMLGKFLAAVPSIFAALLILLIAYIGGWLLGRLATSFMEAIGFDRLPAALGLAKKEAAAPPAPAAAQSAWSPSQVVGYVVLVVIMLFAIVESCRLLGFEGLAAVIDEFVLFLARVLLGLAVLALGLYFGNLAAKAILGSQVARAQWLAMVARVAIIVFASAMALDKIGVGADVVKIGFGLAFGAIAVAAAIAFGLGGRDAAARQIEEWRQKESK